MTHVGEELAFGLIGVFGGPPGHFEFRLSLFGLGQEVGLGDSQSPGERRRTLGG